MSYQAQEKDVYSIASPPRGYPAYTGIPSVAGGSPPQNSTAAFPASPYQQPSYQHTGTSQQLAESAPVQPQQQATTAQPMATNSVDGRLNNLVSYAGACICPNCGQNQITRVTYQAGGYAHIWAIVFGVFLLSCCIPFLVNSFKDVLHTCSSCGVPLAVYHRSGKTVVLAQPAPNMAMQPQVAGAAQQPHQPRVTGTPLQPQSTGAQIQPQSPQPQYSGTPMLSSPAPFAPIGTPIPAVASDPPVYTKS